MEDRIAKAVACLESNGLVAFPTETVYGLGARADHPEAAAKIFAAKQRPSFDPLIVHFADLATAQEWAVFSETALQLANRFWPGPLTLILPRRYQDGQPKIPDIVTSGLDTVGVRIPAHPLALDLLRAVGLPIAAPSANLFGYVSPTTAQHVWDGLGDRVDVILDGGPCAVGVESTIVDITGNEPRLLRPGGLSREEIEQELQVALRWEGFTPPVTPTAPGMLESHYAPHVPLEAFISLEDLDARAHELNGEFYLLSERALPHIHGRGACVLGTGAEMAVRLFATLRELDAAHAPRILALLPENTGLGLAVRDRLVRASRARSH